MTLQGITLSQPNIGEGLLNVLNTTFKGSKRNIFQQLLPPNIMTLLCFDRPHLNALKRLRAALLEVQIVLF